MLLGNYTQNNANPGRNIGGASNPWDWMKVSNVMRFYLGGAVIANVTDRSAFNNGYRPPYSWTLSPKAGGLSIYNGMVGSTSISNANLAGGLLATSDLTGSGNINVTVAGLGYIVSALAGSGLLSGDIAGQVQMAATLIGQGDLTGALGALTSALADLTGTGSISAEGLAATFILADLSGSGNITGAITGLVEVIASITANGDIGSDITGSWPMLSSLAGTGAFTSAIEAIGVILSTLTGSGSLSIIDGVLPATMSADISATGDMVTSESIAAAVWSALAAQFNLPGTMGEAMGNASAGGNPWDSTIEGSFTAGELLKLLVAVSAGKTTIVENVDGSKTITFRDVNDTVDRVESNVKDSERLSVTLDAS